MTFCPEVRKNDPVASVHRNKPHDENNDSLGLWGDLRPLLSSPGFSLFICKMGTCNWTSGFQIVFGKALEMLRRFSKNV